MNLLVDDIELHLNVDGDASVIIKCQSLLVVRDHLSQLRGYARHNFSLCKNWTETDLLFSRKRQDYDL